MQLSNGFSAYKFLNIIGDYSKLFEAHKLMSLLSMIVLDSVRWCQGVSDDVMLCHLVSGGVRHPVQ